MTDFQSATSDGAETAKGENAKSSPTTEKQVWGESPVITHHRETGLKELKVLGGN